MYLELKICQRWCAANSSVHAQPQLMLMYLQQTRWWY